MRPSFSLLPVPENNLIDVERSLGVKLPPRYREFLARGHGGPPEPGAWGSGLDEVDVYEFYRPDRLCRMTDAEDRRLGKLFIAECATGDLFAIDLGTGEIFFREHEHPVDDPAGAYRLAASSLEDFLEGFHEPSY